jgi:hypothetical protein
MVQLSYRVCLGIGAGAGEAEQEAGHGPQWLIGGEEEADKSGASRLAVLGEPRAVALLGSG